MPSRLLLLGDNYVRLCETYSMGEVSYATLSHCWGSLDLLKLTSKTKSSFQSGISLSSLCRTFQDACFVAKYFGFLYMWIDSLCIIQDDKDDWTTESILMSSVYGGSGLNIAATSARDGNDGLFFARQAVKERLEDYFEVIMDGMPKGVRLVNIKTYHLSVSSQPLGTRAWAMQERILAPKTLHFSKMELYWECRTKTCCESFPEELPDLLGKNYTSIIDLSWQFVVAEYTAMRLTYPKDKLVAISGIARHIQRSTNDKYFAGHWRRTLEMSLCWECWDEKGSPRVSRPSIYRAPSWSWASSDRIVMYPDTVTHSDSTYLFSRVVHVSVTTSCNNPFGEVSGALLQLGSPLLLGGHLHEFNESSMVLKSAFGEMPCTITWDASPSNCMVYVVPIMHREKPRTHSR